MGKVSSSPTPWTLTKTRIRFWLAFVAGLLSSGLVSIGIMLPFGPVLISRVLALALELIVPLWLGVVAASMTARYVQHPAYDLVCLTTRSNGQLTWLLFRRVLARCNTLLAYLVGLLPVWVVLALAPNYLPCMNDTCWAVWRQGSPIANGLAALPSVV